MIWIDPELPVISGSEPGEIHFSISGHSSGLDFLTHQINGQQHAGRDPLQTAHAPDKACAKFDPDIRVHKQRQTALQLLAVFCLSRLTGVQASVRRV
jgi:hypothetical protein